MFKNQYCMWCSSYYEYYQKAKIIDPCPRCGGNGPSLPPVSASWYRERGIEPPKPGQVIRKDDGKWYIYTPKKGVSYV